MRNTTKEVIGLDIGTSRIVAARRENDGYGFEAQLNAFVTIPYSRITENVLTKESVPHCVNGAEITVFGNEAARIADLLNVETRRPMTRGVLNPGEPQSLAQIRRLLTSVLGEAPKQGHKVCFTVPAPGVGSEENITYHETMIRQILRDFGYEVRSLNEGLAVIYGELEDSNYTGVGISFGGGLCNVALAYMSVPVLSFSTPKGGDFIDSSAAAVTGELANRVRLVKEDGFSLNGHYSEKIHQALSVYYDDMMQSVVNGLKEAFEASRNVPKLGKKIPLVLSGGSALPAGFRDRFEKLIQEASLPVQFSEIRLASDPLYATAKGALIAALAD